MAIPSTPNVQRHEGNGTDGPWAYEYQYSSNDYLVFHYRDDQGNEGIFDPGTDYVFESGGPNEPTGVVLRTTEVVPVGWKLAIEAQTPAQQETTPNQLRTFREQAFESALDNLALTNRRTLDDVNRAIVVSPIDPPGQRRLENPLPGYVLTVQDETTFRGDVVSAEDVSNAQENAEAAIAALFAINSIFLGEQPSDPTTDLNGNPLTGGEWYFNTTSRHNRVYHAATGLWYQSPDPRPESIGPNELDSNQIPATRGKLGAGIYRSADPFINRHFNFWQRGTSFTAAGGVYTADRWFKEETGASVLAVTREASGVNTQKYRLRYEVTTLDAGQTAKLAQRVDDVRALNGAQHTLVIDAEAVGASRTFSVVVRQHYGSGGSTTDETVIGTVDIGTTRATQTVVVNIPSFSGKTIGDDSFTEIALRSDAGSVHTVLFYALAFPQGDATFETNPIGYRNEEEDFAACEWYFRKSYNRDAPPGSISTNGTIIWPIVSTTKSNWEHIYFGGTRKVVTPVIYSPNSGAAGFLYVGTGAGDQIPTIAFEGETGFAIAPSGGTPGAAVGDDIRAHFTWDAELYD